MNEIKNEKMFPIKITAGVALALFKDDYSSQRYETILEKINPCLPTGVRTVRGYVKNIGGKTIVIDFTRNEILDLQEILWEIAEWNATRGQRRHIETVLDACHDAVNWESQFNN